MTRIAPQPPIVPAPPASLEVDHLGRAMQLFDDTRVVLAGSVVERDFRLLGSMRSDLLRAARMLRLRAAGAEYYAAEYRSGANDAMRAARLLGRAYVQLERFAEVSGGWYGFGWPAMEQQAVDLLRRAKAAVERAREAAYTGTHY